MTQSDKVEMHDITTLSNSNQEAEPQIAMVNEEVCYQ